MSTTSRPRVAVVGTSHWHHKFYRETIARDAEVVAFSDPSPAKIKEVEPFYGEIGRLDWKELLEPALKLDGVVVLAPHDEMREVCLAFIERRIPIILEKPGGLSGEQVGDIRAAAKQAGVPVTVAFIQRLGNTWKHMQRAGTLEYASFNFHSGPPSRYVNQSPWVLTHAHSGGGCFINLGVHYIDLFLGATNAKTVTVQAQAQYLLSKGTDVEDRLTALLTTEAGTSAVIETGYAFPASPDIRYLSYSMRGSDGFLMIDRSGEVAFTPISGPTEVVKEDVDSGPLTLLYMKAAIAGLREGFKDLPQIDQLHRAMQVVTAAYRSAKEGAAVTVTIAW
jgi:predicted dehydrogenase